VFNIKYLRLIQFLTCVVLFSPIVLLSQPQKTYSASEIKLALKKLNVLGSVLYIAAHPDDENTQFLTFCSYEKLCRTGYLSLTRGGGGQNLIGNEQAELLGVIRTEELLQARKFDGANQFFSRAVDFGYTKSPEESFEKWNKEKILSDVVWVIRKFKPDVIVTRFPVTGEGRHGQHTASAILALEAFQSAGDTSIYPEQLEYVDVWSPKRIYWNGWTRAFNSLKINPDTLLSLNFGSYNSLLGKSYTEISAESRSMHKSQGFGDSGWRANYYNYFVYMEGEKAVTNLFEGVDISWNRVKGSDEVSSLIERALKDFDDDNLSKIVPILVAAYNNIINLSDDYWVQIKSRELLNLIRACSGMWMEAITEEKIFTPGSKIIVSTGVVNRSDQPFVFEGVHITHQTNDSLLNKNLVKGNFLTLEKEVQLPDNISFTQPYWLANERNGDIFQVDDQTMIGLAESSPPLVAHFRISINETKLIFSTPVLYRENDPTKGEVYTPIVIAPPVTAKFESELYLFPSNDVRDLIVTLKNLNNDVSGKLLLNVPSSWQVEPTSINFDLTKKKEEKQFHFEIKPSLEESSAEITASIEIDDKIYSKSSATIKYDHIPEKTVFLNARAKLVRLDIGETVVINIGYIMGSGDKVPDYLRELGFKIEIINGESLSKNTLLKYDVIIAGIRAYNTVDEMDALQDIILEYVKEGGTYVVQYNTLSKRYAEPGPYQLKISRDRVAEEDAPVTLISPDHQLLNYPNKITQSDFDGWVQERGLYFPNEWDDNFDPILEMNDKGESPKHGSLLYAKYGKGVFIYTGLSFFRELPAGVPGAYKLFVNLISAGKYEN
jgi:LmbE family N-acetylglucosaminyl deacetylase